MSDAFLHLIDNILTIYLMIIIAWVIASWLVGFGIINPRSPVVKNIVSGLHALVDPVVAPIRKVLPSFGGLDLSPIVLILGIGFIRNSLANYARTGNIL